MSATHLGRVGGQLAEQLAWLTAPAAIAGEIARLEQAMAAGDTSEETRVLLDDWRAIRDKQRELVGGTEQQQALDLAGAAD